MRRLTGIIPILILLAGSYRFSATAQVSQSPPAEFGGHVVLTRLSNPDYPAIARAAGVWGDVLVKVVVGTNGEIESAAVLSGPLMLRPAALSSAQRSTFECQRCERGSESYLLLYSFRMIAQGDCCNAYGAPAAVTSAPDPADAAETRVKISIPHACLCDPASSMTRKVRTFRCLWLWKCSRSADK